MNIASQRSAFVSLALLAHGGVALADRYGIDEAIRDPQGSGGGGWLYLILGFAALAVLLVAIVRWPRLLLLVAALCFIVIPLVRCTGQLGTT